MEFECVAVLGMETPMIARLLQLPPEIVPLVVNVAMLAAYISRREPGKILYWIGACLLTVGLMKMKG
jgi:hypothetical protein